MDEKELAALELDDVALSTVFGGAGEMDAQASCAAEASFDDAVLS